MKRIVMKFGGTSMANKERIEVAAKRILNEIQLGNQVCVVVSAMSGTTNHLIELVYSFNPKCDYAEYDSIIASGEQISSGLLAIALQNLGVKSRSWTGLQAGIKTTDSHGKARIKDIDATHLMKSIEKQEVPVVTGFQGFHEESNRTTTLGRGGSDTSAVALAVAIKAHRCDIYTDVDGVYTADPRIVKNARKLEMVSHEEMLELASLGSKVLQTRSVEIAMIYNMPLRVLSSFDTISGTLITSEDNVMEKETVIGVTATKDEARIILSGIPESKDTISNVFSCIGKKNINVDMILQNTSQNNKTTNVTFTLPENDLNRALDILEQKQDTINYDEISYDKNISKVSIVGIGMRSHAGVAEKMFSTLAEKSISIMDISTSEIKISVLIKRDYVELAVRSLHKAFSLEL